MFLGGAQTPLVRGLLRAAVVRRQNPDAYVEHQFNDTDSPGVAKKKVVSETGFEVVSEKGKGDWYPISWHFPFNSSRPEAFLRGNVPTHGTIVGLNFLKTRELFETQMLEEIHSFVRLVNHQTTRLRLGENQLNVWLERAESLAHAVKSIASNSKTLGLFIEALATHMLGDRLLGVHRTSVANDFGVFKPNNVHPDRWELFNRFLEKTTETMDAYRTIRPCSPELLPYFILTYDEKNRQCREQLFYRNGMLFIGKKCLGEASRMKNIEDFANVCRNELGIVSPSVVPKILPLMATLRSMGTTYLSNPPYMGDVAQFAKVMELPQNEYLSIKFDLTQYVSKAVWKLLVDRARVLYQENYQSIGAYQSDNDTSSISGSFDRALNVWRRNDITLIFLYLLGEDVIDAALDKADLKYFQ